MRVEGCGREGRRCGREGEREEEVENALRGEGKGAGGGGGI